MHNDQIGYDITKLIQTINDINRHRETPGCREQLRQELPFLKSCHSLLGILILGIERDPVYVTDFLTAAE